ncbi:MAG: hypothetical protein ACRD4U_11285 [Candidatus Acidiferrales bacterium]
MPRGASVRLWLWACLFAAMVQLAFGLARTVVATYADLPQAEQGLFLVERGPGFLVAFPFVAVVSRAFPEPLLTLRQLIYPTSAMTTWLIYTAVLWWLLRYRRGKATKLQAAA